MRLARTALSIVCAFLLLTGSWFFASPAPRAAAASPQQSQTQNPPKKPKPGTAGEEQDRPQGQTHISVAVDLVSLNVLVTDQKGNVLTGLKPENFTIYEDNVKQEITHFAPVEANMTVVLLVEYSRLITPFIYEVWNGIYGFANSLRPGDWVAVIGYDMRPEILCDFTQNRQELNEALARFNTPAFSESNLSDALIDTLDRVEETEGKVAVVLLSSGLDTFSKHTYDEALAKCKAANASVYAISLGQSFRIRAEPYMSSEANMEFLMADNRLKSFADFTGGGFFAPRFITEFPDIYRTISAELRNQYSIAYNSSNSKHDGKFRKIRVEVGVDLQEKGKPMKLKVLTRKGYMAKQGA